MLTARRFNLVADSGTRWHEFLHIPIAIGTGKRLRVFGPDKNPGRWLKVSLSRQICLDGIIPVDG